MERSFGFLLTVLAGVALLTGAGAVHLIALEASAWPGVLAAGGIVLACVGAFGLRAEFGQLLRRRRVEAALFSLGIVGVLVCLAWLSARFPVRVDMTEARVHSLSRQSEAVLARLENPVHVVFFHDALMRESVELYEQIAAQSDRITVEFHDPTLNPARARMLGVRFAGTSLMTSGDRRLQVHGRSETDIVNGILRVTQGARIEVCFLDGHNEADAFSKESHDHMEGSSADHQHGLGAQYVLHERHGLAKARGSLETLSYDVRAIALTREGHELERCALLVVAGPRSPLLPGEVTAIRGYLDGGGDALFMLEPFVVTGLEPLIRELGIVLDDTLVIDGRSHYWTDVAAPAVTRYNDHPITRELPLTFFPGARSLSPTPGRVPGTSVEPVVNTSPESFASTDPARATFDPGSDRRGPLTLMAVVNRRPVKPGDAETVLLGRDDASLPSRVRATSRVAVIGDSDFATNSFFHFLGNGDLFLNTVGWLTARENLIGVEPRTHDLPRLSMTNRQMTGIVALSMVLVPGLLALIGTAVWWRQR